MSDSGAGGHSASLVPAGFLLLHGSAGIERTVRAGAFRPGRDVWLPADPGLPHTACICAAPAGFAGIFYGVLELVYPDRRHTGWTASDGSSCSMGICQIPVSGKRVAVVSLYAFDGSSLSGNYTFACT